MIRTEDLRKAELAIQKTFSDSADNPAATLVASVDPKARCYGQHLIASTAQRGLHGTASAMRVHRDSGFSGAKDTYKALVYYCENRREIESKLSVPEAVKVEVIAADDLNIIKTAEVLLGLAEAPTSAGVGKFAQSLATKLEASRCSDKGWGYFVGASNESELLPTCWAVLALASHRYDVSASAELIRQRLGDTQSDIVVRVFALYVLAEVSVEDGESGLRGRFVEFWDQLSPLLSQEIESNIEYVSTAMSRVYYVRVPWQLYLLACAARFSPYRSFASPTAQRRLESVVRGVTSSAGLVYPHSGRLASTRTNAIVFDVLRSIQKQVDVRRLPLRPFYWWRRMTDVARGRAAGILLRSLAGVIAAVTIAGWVRSDNFNWSDAVAPNLLTSALLFGLAQGRHRL